MICAFEGWNDAAESASGVVSHLRDMWNAELLLELDPEEYYDYQVNRPHTFVTDSGEHGIVWPGTRGFHSTRTRTHQRYCTRRWH